MRQAVLVETIVLHILIVLRTVEETVIGLQTVEETAIPRIQAFFLLAQTPLLVVGVIVEVVVVEIDLNYFLYI